MDRREAMLREMNLYPLWVRRDASGQEPVHREAVAVPESVSTASVVSANDAPVSVFPVHGVESQDVSCQVAEDSPQLADLFAVDASLPADDSQSGEDSLREFHLQNAGGLLGRVEWPELKQKVHDCQLCKLRAGCTQTVFGTGDEQADWLFVGEAPGHDEDEQGVPFAGEAGRLLDNMLVAIKLRRNENVYIANVIKCRPPDDRHPHVGEIATCLPYLKRQIGLVKPKLIVALGKTAATALLDTDATVASLRGRVHDYTGIPLIVTYHPAYLLRSPMEKARAWEDLCLAVNTIKDVKGIC